MDNPYAAPEADEALSAEEARELGHEAGHYQLASRWARFCAVIIDTIILVIPAIGIGIVLGLMGLMGDEFGQTSIAEDVISSLIGFGIYLLINFHLINTRGQTVGKVLMKIKVVTTEFEPITAKKYILIRVLPFWIIPIIPVVNLIGILDAIMIFRAQKNCLHDDLAGTRVVNCSPVQGDDPMELPKD